MSDIVQKFLLFIERKNPSIILKEEMAITLKRIYLLGPISKEELKKNLFGSFEKALSMRRPFNQNVEDVLSQLEELGMISSASFEDGKVILEVTEKLFLSRRALV